MSEFIHNNIRLHYETTGKGIPLFFLHGLGGSIEQVRNTYIPIEGVKLIALDQQGHGESEVDWDTYHFRTLAEDVIALADYLKIDQFYLAGISMGAAVSVNLAVSHPDRLKGLLLIRNAWTDKPMEKNIQRLFAECAKCLKKGNLSDYKKTKGYAFLSGISDYTTQAFCGYFTEKASLRNYRKFLVLPALAPIESPAVLSKVNLPAIVLANRSDLVHPFEYGTYYQKHIPGAKLYEIASKDADKALHKAAINKYISELLQPAATA